MTEKKKKKPEMRLWLNSAHGVYIPRYFAHSFDERPTQVRGVSDDEWKILEAGPEHEHYWDVWDSVERNAIVKLGDVEYFVRVDEDVWLVPIGMEWSDSEDAFVWPPGDSK
jgi:hypothetical protein